MANSYYILQILHVKIFIKTNTSYYLFKWNRRYLSRTDFRAFLLKLHRRCYANLMYYILYNTILNLIIFIYEIRLWLRVGTEWLYYGTLRRDSRCISCQVTTRSWPIRPLTPRPDWLWQPPKIPPSDCGTSENRITIPYPYSRDIRTPSLVLCSAQEGMIK